ncbi:MAG: glutamine--fructose-6-phosphate transaminase (isomerizing) [Candidatus Wildermuthbacteria bacterium]|nr:glutamine--fructose-6-phosphate transaminase (isomerizing) [Candidatus Wildermuthbacteria bacterium]
MCGIIGYIGKEEILPVLIDGLRRESYRGYDSSGVVVIGNTTQVLKEVGKLENLEAKAAGTSFSGEIGLGHSRWATHGGVTQENAHPHTDCKDAIFVVHNGIIENFRELRAKLESEGHVFRSETDTEVLPHLIEHFFKGNIEDATRKALSVVRGTYGIAVISALDPGKIIAARLSSPLVVAINGKGGFVASDPAALISYSNRMIFMEDREVAVITASSVAFTDLENQPRAKEETQLDWDIEEAQKGGYEHFMLKEIMEQPESIENSMRGRILTEEGMAKFGGLEGIQDQLTKIKRIKILACGTSYHAGVVGKYLFEEYAGIPTDVEAASEFRYRKTFVLEDTLFLFISQSGETADTLAAVKEVKLRGGLTLGIVNVVGSSIARETHAGIYNHAGPEIGVASTKAYTSQLAILMLLVLLLGRQRGMNDMAAKQIAREIGRIPSLAKSILSRAKEVQAIANKYAGHSNFLYIGRKYNYPTALEGALKLKEISYVHAEGYSAGEMKHGPLALVDSNFPTVAMCLSGSVYEKILSNVQEIKARRGPIIAVATEGDEDIKEIADDVFYIPETLEMMAPILGIIPLQLFAYYIGVLKGYDVDKPRNLAKSVTVE